MEPNPPADVTLTPATPGTPGPFLRYSPDGCPHCWVQESYPAEGARCASCGDLLCRGLVIATVGGPPAPRPDHVV